MDRMHPFISASMFRLCCLIDAARSDGQSFKINYANSDLDTVLVRRKLILDIPKPQKNEFPVRAVGCVVNRKYNGEIAFYVRNCKQDVNSVFVLNTSGEKEEEKLIVSSVIHNLHQPIKHVTYFF
mgnify:CR=1 FL=1